MLVAVSRSCAPTERRRRVHVKSKNGCRNCKLRRVKCDESRPSCKKCKLYGVSCDYNGLKSSLHPSAQGSFQVEFSPIFPTKQKGGFGFINPRGYKSIRPKEVPSLGEQVINFNTVPSETPSEGRTYAYSPFSPISVNSTIAVMINDSLQSGLASPDPQASSGAADQAPTSFWNFSESHLEILARFHIRTSISMGNKKLAPAYRDVTCQLAFTHTFLMHMLLGLTLMHDAELSLSRSPALAAKQKHASLQHWNTAIELFNGILAGPIPPYYRDAIWATGVFLGTATYWYVESTSAEEVWPLKPDDPGDLTWMKLGEGKRHLWRIADPSRPESMFSSFLKERPCAALPKWVETNNTLPMDDRVKRTLNITPDSTITNNAYLLPALIVSHVQGMRLTKENTQDFLYIAAFVTPEFLALLEVKDPRAVFVLGWWFKMVQDGELWWLTRRAKVEGEAVRIWLQRNEPKLAEILDSLVRDPARESDEPSWPHIFKAGVPMIQVD